MSPSHSATISPEQSLSAQCQTLVKWIAESTGEDWTFGYIGNCGVDGRGRFDDRCWFAFRPHPGRVGTEADRIGGYPTSQLATLRNVLHGAARMAAMLNGDRRVA